jgi:Dolichyl-phosphate-mannose-protein mannosyltransferase
MRKPVSNRAFSLLAFVAGIEGLLALFFITREPSEAGSALVFGLSLQRLLIVTGVLLLASFFVVVAVAHVYRLISWNESINRKPQLIRYFLAFMLILEWVALQLIFLIPDYYFPTLSGYLPRLKPVLVWLAFLFAQTFLFLAYYENLFLESLTRWRGKKPILIVLLIVGLIWGLVALTGIGIIPDDLYWNVAGVPLLAGQIWLAIGVTFLVWFLYKRFVARNSLSWILSFSIFIGIWVVAAVLWIKTPLGPSFNAPGPYLPDREFYPFVDAALFDLGAQSAVYGKGLFFGAFIDRALLSGFLAFIHRIFGQDYLVVVGVQTAVYAGFPAILYLLGKKIHSISAGVMIAALAIFKVSNAITGGRLISTSHPKLMLTEFPTGIALVLVCIFLVQWLKSSKASNLAAVGASIGVGILLRHNVLFMFPVMVLMGFAVWRQRWKLALRDLLLVTVAFFITISPWMWRNQRVAGEPFFFLLHFNRVIEERYQPESHLERNRLASDTFPRALRTNTIISQTKSSNLNILDLNQYKFIPKHFAHNLITSVLVLPPSPVLDDFRHVVDDYPYWGRMGNSSLGDISGSMGVFLAVNLIIFSLGLGAAWKRVKFAALAPLMVFFFYNLANAFARTSGGRYIVPVDWVIYFYYAIGLIEIIRFCISALGFHAGGYFENFVGSRPEHENARLNWGRVGLIVVPFFLIVAMLPVVELASPGEKPPETTGSLLEQLDKNSFFEISGLSRQDVEQFLGNSEAQLISGRGLYPRYYSYDQGEPILPGQITAYTPREFPRLVFTLLLPTMDRPVVLPIDEPKLSFPDAAEVIVGGCQVGQSTVLSSYLNYIDAAFVVILDERARVYMRVPEAPLACPLRVPVCDNNHNCN